MPNDISPTIMQPLSKRSKRLLDARESEEVPSLARVQFDDYAGNKSNSMSFAELRLRQEQQKRLMKQESSISNSEHLILDDCSLSNADIKHDRG